MADHPSAARGIRQGAVLILGSLVLGAGIGIALVAALYVALTISPERLDMKRHLWNVATEAEREQIREILFRSYADPALICELTAKRPLSRPLDLAVLPPVEPEPLLPPKPPAKPAHPFADTP